MIRRCLSLLLLAVLPAGFLPVPAGAQEPPGYPGVDQVNLIGGLTDPRNHGSGYFLDTEYGRYTHLDLGFGTIDTKAGLFDKIASRGYEFRVSAVEPILHGEIPFGLREPWLGELQIGLVASYSRIWYNTNTSAYLVQGNSTYFLDDLNTNLWGFGPDARFLFPPNERCMRMFVGARFEGLGGWANPDPALVAAPNPANGTIPVRASADVGRSDDVWGLRGEWSVGVMFRDETTISGSFGLTKLRTKVIDDLENNNDYTSWSINFGVPTDVILCRLRLLAGKLGL